MSMISLLSRLRRALPVIIASLPAVVDAAKEVKKALKKEKPQTDSA